MPVEGLHSGEQFAVVSAGDEDLCVVAYGSLEQRQRTRRKLVSLQEGKLVLGQF